MEIGISWRFFLVLGETVRKFFAISGLPLNPYPSSQNHAICSQFVPKLEHLIYYDSLFGFFLIYILNFNFSEFQNDEVQQIDKN